MRFGGIKKTYIVIVRGSQVKNKKKKKAYTETLW